jgi:hypothetical protein
VEDTRNPPSKERTSPNENTGQTQINPPLLVGIVVVGDNPPCNFPNVPAAVQVK